MDIEIFTLCDAAADYQGRLNILGVFDTIFAAQIPATHPFCSVALRIRFTSIERGEHRLALQIVDDDGVVKFPPIQGQFQVKLPAHAPFATTNLVLNLGNLQFEKYGVYEVDLAIDGRQVATLPFSVRRPS